MFFTSLFLVLMPTGKTGNQFADTRSFSTANAQMLLIGTAGYVGSVQEKGIQEILATNVPSTEILRNAVQKEERKNQEPEHLTVMPRQQIIFHFRSLSPPHTTFPIKVHVPYSGQEPVRIHLPPDQFVDDQQGFWQVLLKRDRRWATGLATGSWWIALKSPRHSYTLIEEEWALELLLQGYAPRHKCGTALMLSGAWDALDPTFPVLRNTQEWYDPFLYPEPFNPSFRFSDMKENERVFRMQIEEREKQIEKEMNDRKAAHNLVAGPWCTVRLPNEQRVVKGIPIEIQEWYEPYVRRPALTTENVKQAQSETQATNSTEENRKTSMKNILLTALVVVLVLLPILWTVIRPMLRKKP